jgi:hypothetical protein
MNTDIAITQETSEVHTLDFNPNTKPIHRKIAKLPKPLRDLINTSLDDNLPARQIIEKLQASSNPPLPYPISEVNISDWRKTGYRRYLAHQDHLDSIEASREAAIEMVRTSNNLSLPQATLQVIASQCFEILGEFSPAAVKQKLAEDPLKYTSFLHVFARLTREIVHLEKFIEARAAAQAQKSDPNRDPKAEAAEFWTRHTKNLFNRKDPDRVKTKTSKPSTPIPESETASASEISPSNSVPLANSSDSSEVPSSIQHPASAPSTNPSIHQSNNPSPAEHCLDCHHPLPPLTPGGKRPHDRCQICNILLPPPGTCTRPSADKCHHCGATLPRRLPNGRRPKPTCHNCGAGLGRELDEDIQKYAQE